MAAKKSDIETLLIILENIHNPEMLDTHSWVSFPFVQDAVAKMPGLQSANPGRQLVGAMEAVFSRTMPSVPPRRGKRLDTRWGEFGLMAARYFAPFHFGTPVPSSLRDAWGRIDSSILLYVFGRGADSLTADQIDLYKFTGNEAEVAPASTLSDWHRKGVQRLADAIHIRNQHLIDHPSESKSLETAQSSKDPSRGSSSNRNIRLAILILLLLILGVGIFSGIRAWQIYNQAKLVWKDASQLRGMVSSSPSLEQVKQAGSSLALLHQDVATLKSESQPFLWLGPLMGWVPVYGGDLAAAPDLVTLSDSLLSSADLSYQAASPLVAELSGPSGQPSLTPSHVITLLMQAQPQLTEAQNELDQAVTARSHLDTTRLSPGVSRVILKDVDPILSLMQSGLAIGLELPRITGATNDGPKTYLLLAENSDELRPTGGFITAAGTVLLQDGHISNLDIHNSGEVDNWNHPYPTAPWQLNQYMGSPVLIFRDSNWFTNYPTAALYAEDLYSYYSGNSVNGVIAFDQQLLINVLGAVGPVQVDCSTAPIDASNVMSFMRETKTTSPNVTPCWKKDTYLVDIAHALLNKILNGDVPWKRLILVLFQSLNEHHLLIKLDDPALTSVIASRGWDGAVKPGNGDFLMVVDSNIGYNKTNAVVDTSVSYDVNLTNPSAPLGTLNVVHQNNAARDIPCIPNPYISSNDTGLNYYEEHYPIDRCFWDYLRVYKPAGTQLLSATPQSIPGEWMIRKQPVPAKVDVLDEGIPGVQGFGTLKIVPGGQVVTSSFQFGLPATILKSQGNSNQLLYHLRVQKQPGTLAVPIAIRIDLPENATIQQMPGGSTVQGHTILLQTNLGEDLELDFVFSLP